MSILSAIFGDVTWKALSQQSAEGWDGIFGTLTTQSGERVDPDRAMRVATYYACISMIAETMGLLPFNVYKQSGKVKTIDNEHPAQRLLHAEPNDNMSAETFRSTMTAHYLGSGNAYAEIEKNGAGQAIALWPIHYSRVEPAYRPNGDIYYKVHMTDATNPMVWSGKVVEVPKDRLLHLKTLSNDGLVGMSIARLAAQSLGVRMAAERYGASYFRNASRPSGIISHPETVTLNPDQKARLREQWQSVYGGADNVGRVAVLESGGKYQSIKIDPNEAQFIETMDHTDLEICRWFRMPPWKVGIQDQAKGWGTLEATNTQYVQDCLTIHAIRWESEVNKKLLGGWESDHFAKIEFNALLRGDIKTRQGWYEGMTRIGVYTINEVREFEDMEGIGEEGDKHMVQLNLTTVDKVGEDKEPAVPAVNPFQQQEEVEGEPEETEDENEGEDEDEDMAATLRPVILDAASRIVRKRENEFARLAARKPFDANACLEQMAIFQSRENANNQRAFDPICACIKISPDKIAVAIDAMDEKATSATKQRMTEAGWTGLTDEQQSDEANRYADAITVMLSMKGY